MKFFTKPEDARKTVLIWNGGKVIAVFRNGEFETEERAAIAVLKEWGFRSEGEEPVDPEEAALRERAAALDIKNLNNKKPETLLKEIEEAEKAKTE